MFGSPLRHGYHEGSRHGPLLLADTSEHDELLPAAESLPGTPHRPQNQPGQEAHSSASQRSGIRERPDTRSSTSTVSSASGEAKTSTPAKFRIGSKRFDDLLATAVKHVEKQEKKAERSRNAQSPQTTDPFVVVPFSGRGKDSQGGSGDANNGSDDEEEGEGDNESSMALMTASRTSRLKEQPAPRFMSDTAFLGRGTDSEQQQEQQPPRTPGAMPSSSAMRTSTGRRHPAADADGRARPPPVVAWNAPDDSIVMSPSSVSVASPRRIIVQALAEDQEGQGEGQGDDQGVIPAPTPFRPAKIARARAAQRARNKANARRAWEGGAEETEDEAVEEHVRARTPLRSEQMRVQPRTRTTQTLSQVADSDRENAEEEEPEDDETEDEDEETFDPILQGGEVPSNAVWAVGDEEEDEEEVDVDYTTAPVHELEDEPHGAVYPEEIITPDSTELQVAAAHGVVERVAALLTQGEDVNEQDAHGRTALMYAVHCNQLETVRLLLSQGAAIDHRAADGATALHRAAYCGTRAMVMLLLQSGADHRIPDAEGRLPLHWSTHNANIKCLSALLKKVDHNMVNHLDAAGMSALLWAAYYDRPNHVRKLLRHKADLSVADIDGKRAIHWAVVQGSMQCLRLLLTVESSMIQDNIGRTVAHYAAEVGNKKALKAVLRVRPAAVNDTDVNGRSPLHYAAVCMQPKAVRVLLKHGAPIELQDTQGWVALDYAVHKQSAECAALLSAAQSGRPLTIPEQQAQVAMAVPSEPIDVEASSPAPEVQTLFSLLASGTYLLKYTSGGKGPAHHRFFWIDMLTGEVCWAKSPDAFYKHPTSVEGRPLTSVIAHPSIAVRSRADYNPEKTHRFAFIINTAGRRLDVVAPSEAILRLWVEGVRCLAAYQDSLLLAVQSRYSQDMDALEEEMQEAAVDD